MMDVEWWMVDSFRIQNCSFKISQPVRSVRFQEIIFLTGFTELTGRGRMDYELWILNGGLRRSRCGK